MQWSNVSLIGVGLLGGSLGLALKQRKIVGRVTGYVRRAASVEECQRLGAVDHATLSLPEAVADADLVVLCTPVGDIVQLAENILPHLKPGTLLTDVGSVKAPLVQALYPACQARQIEFVGSHPMAGSEKSGVQHAQPTLFDRAMTIVTPAPGQATGAVERACDLWKAVGAHTIVLSPDLHDELVGRSSHLPHIVAAGLANYILSPMHPKEQAALCATGFRDTTRLASGAPEMWRDIALANRRNISRVLGVFIEDLQEFQVALDSGDTDLLEDFFSKARDRREQWRQNAMPSHQVPSETSS